MAKLYANENFPLPVVKELRKLGHEVLTIQETGKAGQSVPDEDILNFASNEGMATLTINRKHFVRLHKIKPDHAGIIVCSFDHDFIAMASRIDEEIKSISQLSGRLIRINRPAQ